MEALFDAIQSTFAANSTLSAEVSGGLFRDEGKQVSASYPYGVVKIEGDTPEYYMPVSTATNVAEVFAVTFRFHDDDRSSENTTTIEGLMKGVFDHVTMTVVGYTNVYTARKNSFAYRDPKKRWVLDMDYEIRLRKT